MVCHSFLQWATFCQTFPSWPAHLGWAHRAWLSFIELDKAVVHVIRLISFLWLWFQCLPSDALSQHLLSYLGFCYLGHGVLHGCSSKEQPLLLTLDEGYLLTADPPNLERGVAPLSPPMPMQPPLLEHALFIIGDWNAKVGSQETPGVTGKFGLEVQNEAGKRLIEFYKENALVITDTLFQQCKWRLHMDITRWSILKSDWLYSLQPKMEKLYTVSKNKTRTDYGSDHELLIVNFRLKLKKVGKTTRPFRYDLNQIHYDYTVEVTNRFKGLDLTDRVSEEL